VTTPAHGSPWPDDLVRVFLSHSALHKQFAGEVAQHLREVGVYGFVAHDTMTVSLPWQEQIEEALRTAEALVALIHPEFNNSAWCQQEIGWALGRGIPVFCVRIGHDPQGFPGRTQWPSAYDQKANDVARTINGWLNTQPSLSDRITGGLIKALEEAGNYYDAETAAKALDAIGTLTTAQWEAVDQIVRTNDQIGRSVLALRVLKPFYARVGRDIPKYTG
jgi:TIR domain